MEWDQSSHLLCCLRWLIAFLRWLLARLCRLLSGSIGLLDGLCGGLDRHGLPRLVADGRVCGCTRVGTTRVNKQFYECKVSQTHEPETYTRLRNTARDEDIRTVHIKNEEECKLMWGITHATGQRQGQRQGEKEALTINCHLCRRSLSPLRRSGRVGHLHLLRHIRGGLSTGLDLLDLDNETLRM